MPFRSLPFRNFKRGRIPVLFVLVATALIFMTLSTGASFDRQTADQGQQIFQQK